MNALLVAAVAACGAVCAQPEIVSIDPEAQLLEQIAALQAEAGASRPAALIEPLGALAFAHQEAGAHTLAIAALEEARYVTRVHNGLASADEALLLRVQIRSEKALGNHERVWDLERDMLALARQNHDDVRMLPIFRDVVDDRLAVAEKVRAGERPPLIYAGCYNASPLPPYDYTTRGVEPPVNRGNKGGSITNPCFGGTNSYLIDRLNREVLMYYADAIETILRTGDYASQELRELEKAALRTGYITGGVALLARESDASSPGCSGGTLDYYASLEIVDSCLAPIRRGPNYVVAGVGGRVGLVRLIVYEIKSAASVAARANAIAELADWHIAVISPDRRRFSTLDELAVTLYERAYRELEEAGGAEASSAELFAPELPVTLPTFVLNPFDSVATDSPRYIDVAFAVTKRGTAEQIEILDTSRDSSRGEERDLTRLIENRAFRPRFVDGKLSDSAPVTVRYHLNPR